MNTSWSIGVLVGGPIAAIFFLAFAVGAFLLFRALRKADAYDRGVVKGLAWTCVAAATLTVLIAAASFYPWKAEYHQWQGIQGEIQSISSRFLGGDNSTTQRFVVRFKDGTVRSCDDTRCALYAAGDTLQLSCKREWQFSGTDGWSCNYVGGSKDES